jgi:hypothetical protein
MSREPKVVIVGTSSLPTNDVPNPSAIFDDSDEENNDALNEDTPTGKKPPGPVAAFFIRNRAWVITIGVLLLTVIALSLTVYFINIKCNNTVREERDRANRMINELEEQTASSTTARDRYCEEAQRLRSQLRELSTEYDRLKNAPPPKAVNKLHQKKILQEYNDDGEEPVRPKKHKKVSFAQNDEAISVDLPKPSSSVRRDVEEAVSLNALNGAEDMNAVVTTPEDEFDDDVIDM